MILTWKFDLLCFHVLGFCFLYDFGINGERSSSLFDLQLGVSSTIDGQVCAGDERRFWTGDERFLKVIS